MLAEGGQGTHGVTPPDSSDVYRRPLFPFGLKVALQDQSLPWETNVYLRRQKYTTLI